MARAASTRGPITGAPFFIDYETRSTIDLKTAGAHKYAGDCEILCMAFGQVGGPISVWTPDQPLPKQLIDHVRNGGTLAAHNASGFERLIWPKDWPQVHTWQDTAAECRAMGVPGSLDRAGEYLGVEAKKDAKGKRLMLKIAKSTGRVRLDELSALGDYCKQDVAAEMSIHGSVRRLSDSERRVYTYTEKVNDRGIPVDIGLAQSASALWSRYTDRIDEEIRNLTGGISGRRVAALADWLGLKTLDRKTIDQELKTATGDRHRVLTLRREIGQAAASKFDAVLAGTQDDGRLRGCLLYHGARTGRWSGRRFQPQNLARGIVPACCIEPTIEAIHRGDIDALEMAHGSVAETLGSMVRPVIAAPRLVACDYASVEARALAWAAGETELVESFAKGRDVYVEMAKAIGPNVSRQIGKTAVLGAGYGLGGRGFQKQCPASITPAFAQKVIDRYRSKNRKIVQFWRQLERASIKAVETGSARCGVFTFRTESPWLFAKLPSGREIAFYKPSIGLDRFGRKAMRYTGTDVGGRPRREDSYGGKLAENVISGLCRDLLVEACYRLEDAGCLVVLTVHDEVLCECGDPREVERIMSVVPDWAQGLPIASEAQEFQRYRK